MTAEEFAQFIADGRWQFAKTMANIPHAYSVREWNDDKTFADAVAFIRENGYPQRFYSKTYTYYDHGPHQYWTMGFPIEETTIINRAVRPGEETTEPLATPTVTDETGVPDFGPES